MDKEDVVNYVMTTPNNTNPAILRQMLDQISGGSNGSGVFRFCSDSDSRQLNHTWQEIYDAIKAGMLVLLQEEPQELKLDENAYVVTSSTLDLQGIVRNIQAGRIPIVFHDEEIPEPPFDPSTLKYVVSYTENLDGALPILYACDSPNDYPVYVDPN